MELAHCFSSKKEHSLWRCACRITQQIVGNLGKLVFCLNAYPNATLWPVARDLLRVTYDFSSIISLDNYLGSTENRSCSIVVNFMKHGTLEVVGFAFLVTNE